jgi:nickel-dependent lactate racemase
MFVKVVNSDGSPISDIQLNYEVQKYIDELIPPLSSSSTEEDPPKTVMLLPPDYTRYHSKAGTICSNIYKSSVDSPSSSNEGEGKISSRYKVTDVMPALGTHSPMSNPQLLKMFGPEMTNAKPGIFRVHDWRNDVITIGEAPSHMIKKATGGLLNVPWPAQVNKLVWDGGHDIVLSIGQVVPHEVMGMANYNKNLFIGVGGSDAINLSHFIGAVYGMEKMMGRSSNPLREILNYCSEKFLLNRLNLHYVLTVMGSNQTTGELEMKGKF